MLPECVYKILLLIFIFALLSLFYLINHNDENIKQFFLNKMSFKNKVNITTKINHDLQIIMDEAGLKIQEASNNQGRCLIELISFNTVGTGDNNQAYTGYVMYSREYDTILKKSVDGREENLRKTHRDINYGYSFSKQLDEWKQDYPRGFVKLVKELVSKDSPNHTIMHDTFVKQEVDPKNGITYYGNFRFPVHAITASFIKEKETNNIVFHPTILCDEKAYNTIDYRLFDIQAELTDKIIKYSNKNEDKNLYI